MFRASANRQYGVIVPTVLNDGSPVSPLQREAVEQAIVLVSDGYTCISNVVGVWRDGDGRWYREVNDLYFVAAPGDKPIVALARDIGSQLDQIAIYVQTPDGRVLIVMIDAMSSANAKEAASGRQARMLITRFTYLLTWLVQLVS